ncbi:hypothetical protein C0J52_17884 [Blattella germanica]|nr:hypothetical protein C0J52_17884 [Blattella germanica]
MTEFQVRERFNQLIVVVGNMKHSSLLLGTGEDPERVKNHKWKRRLFMYLKKTLVSALNNLLSHVTLTYDYLENVV